jgi:hypothetical protein
LQTKDPKDQLEIGMHVKYLQTKHPKDQLEIGMHVKYLQIKDPMDQLKTCECKHFAKQGTKDLLKKTCECITHKHHKHKFLISQGTTHHKSAQIMIPTTFISRHELGILSWNLHYLLPPPPIVYVYSVLLFQCNPSWKSRTQFLIFKKYDIERRHLLCVPIAIIFPFHLSATLFLDVFWAQWWCATLSKTWNKWYKLSILQLYKCYNHV